MEDQKNARYEKKYIENIYKSVYKGLRDKKARFIDDYVLIARDSNIVMQVRYENKDGIMDIHNTAI